MFSKDLKINQCNLNSRHRENFETIWEHLGLQHLRAQIQTKRAQSSTSDLFFVPFYYGEPITYGNPTLRDNELSNLTSDFYTRSYRKYNYIYLTTQRTTPFCSRPPFCASDLLIFMKRAIAKYRRKVNVEQKCFNTGAQSLTFSHAEGGATSFHPLI